VTAYRFDPASGALAPFQVISALPDTFTENSRAAEMWRHLNDTSAWSTYFSNVSDIRFHDGSGPELHQGARFCFTTFSFPVEAEVMEYEPPSAGKPARVAWHGWVEGQQRLDWTSTTPGCLTTCPPAACGSSPGDADP
jgi:hypothetical protein